MTLKLKTPPVWKRYELLPAPVIRGPRGELVELPGLSYKRGRLVVRSSADVLDFRGEKRPQYVISVSDGDGWGNRRRATDEQVAQVLRDFDAVGAEEDNHGSGVSRCFFLLADLKPGEAAVCECKEDEEVVVEPDGYAYSRSKTGGDTYEGIPRPPEGWAGRKLGGKDE